MEVKKQKSIYEKPQRLKYLQQARRDFCDRSRSYQIPGMHKNEMHKLIWKVFVKRPAFHIGCDNLSKVEA